LETTQGQCGRFGRHPALAPATTSTYAHGYPQPPRLPSCESSHRTASPPLPPAQRLEAPGRRAAPVDGPRAGLGEGEPRWGPGTAPTRPSGRIRSAYAYWSGTG